MHAVPIQMSAMIQITLRTGTGTNRPARMAACGIRHANRLVRGLLSQSRERWTVSTRTAGSRAALARALGLDRWTGHRAVGTEHTAIALLRPQPHATTGALIEKLARIGRHGLRFGGPAVRAGNHRLVDHGCVLEVGDGSRAYIRCPKPRSDRRTWSPSDHRP